ncbi:MAG: hypothetical protein ACHQPI_14165 [Thermoanaerobaculia bacterium]
MDGKTKRRGLGILALAVVGTLALAYAAAAQTPAPFALGQGRPFLRALRGGLATAGVTDDQKTKIKAILEGKKDAAQVLAAQTRVDAKALHDLANAATSDPATVGKAFLTLKGDRDAAKALADGVLTQIKGVLTPEQAGKLDGYLAALKQVRRARMGRG